MSTFKNIQQQINEKIAEAEDAVILNRIQMLLSEMSEVEYIRLKEIADKAIHADNKEQDRELRDFLMRKLKIDNGLQRKG